MSRRTCLLCGAEDQPTAVQIVRWVKPLPGQEYSTLPRCVDRAACQGRVEASRDEKGRPGVWEVAS